MVKQDTLSAELAEMLGELAVTSPNERHAIDGLAPQVAASPSDYEEVCRLMAYANENRLAVIPIGGHQHSDLGNVPERYDIALETRRLSGVVEFEPADLTITVRAGMTLGELRNMTSASGLMVPFDPGIADRATVGGLLAANISGPARVSLCQPRDFTIGMRVVTANGRLTRAGGRVVKNVAGYDLCKLYIGSLGTLAVVVEATFKTIPLPIKQLSLAFHFSEPGSACDLVSAAVRRGLKVQSARLVRERSGWRLLLDVSGTPGAVARSEFDIAAAASAAGAPQVSPETPSIGALNLISRLETLPPQLPALLGEASNALAESHIEAQPWDGVCRVGSNSPEDLQVIQGLAKRHRASLVIERCPPELKAEMDVFGDLPAAFRLMQSIKREFDPNEILSPGRFVGRL